MLIKLNATMGVNYNVLDRYNRH